ncbi:MAG: N-acetyltransferase [Brevundimonas sp.]|uniref:N-acetyltransferase n=1 Tax=Brevundimonas sp. TaxID=1871086 RepID=UPI00391B4370
MALRECTPFDREALNALRRRVWWPERSRASWCWLMRHPVRQERGDPLGWVITREDQVRACLGLMVETYVHQGARLFAATGHSLIVPPVMKGRSKALIETFLDVKGVFAHHTLNANARSSPIYGRFGMVPHPPQTHALKLSWCLDPLACAQARGYRAIARQAPRLAHALGERLLGPRLHRPIHARMEPGVVFVSCESAAWQRFWDGLQGSGRLMLDRSPAMMRWRMSDPDQTTVPVLLGFVEDGELSAAAFAQVGKDDALSAPVLEVLDLVALSGAAVRGHSALIRALKRIGRALGAAKLRLPVVSPEVLDALGPMADEARVEGGWGHCHVRFAPGEEARWQGVWQPMGLDGDYVACLRPAPLRGKARAVQDLAVADEKAPERGALRGRIVQGFQEPAAGYQSLEPCFSRRAAPRMSPSEAPES